MTEELGPYGFILSSGDRGSHAECVWCPVRNNITQLMLYWPKSKPATCFPSCLLGRLMVKLRIRALKLSRYPEFFLGSMLPLHFVLRSRLITCVILYLSTPLFSLPRACPLRLLIRPTSLPNCYCKMATWDADPNLGHNVSLSLLSAWDTFRDSQKASIHRLPPFVLESGTGTDLKHELLSLALGINYIAPEVVQANLARHDGPAPKILDIGTGTGAWAIAMAKEFPHAEVLGIDLVTPSPLEPVPSNCRFEVDDVNLSLDHHSNCFDVIHVRLVDGGIYDYPKFLNQVARMLRPGGILLLVELLMQHFSETCQPLPINDEGEPGFTYLQKVFTATHTAIMNRGGSVHACTSYKFLLSQDPNFEQDETDARNLFIPVGRWRADLDSTSVRVCEMMRMNHLVVFRAVKPILLNDGQTESDIDRWTTEAEKELRTLSVKVYSKWAFAWAIRGAGEWVEIEPYDEQTSPPG